MSYKFPSSVTISFSNEGRAQKNSMTVSSFDRPRSTDVKKLLTKIIIFSRDAVSPFSFVRVSRNRVTSMTDSFWSKNKRLLSNKPNYFRFLARFKSCFKMPKNKTLRELTNLMRISAVHEIKKNILPLNFSSKNTCKIFSLINKIYSQI